MKTAEDILTFWLEDIGEADWYTASDALDTKIRDTFLETWGAAREGACGLWLTSPPGMLAYIILMDQFPRNMFRGHADAFATDPNARAATRIAIERDWDLEIAEPARQFFYLPLMHAESLTDQDRAARLIHERMPETGASNLLHAHAHRAIIREFGRFPFRNIALGRTPSAAEIKFMENGGYVAEFRAQQSADKS